MGTVKTTDMCSFWVSERDSFLEKIGPTHAKHELFNTQLALPKDGPILQTNLLVNASCCEECYRPKDYVRFSVLDALFEISFNEIRRVK